MKKYPDKLIATGKLTAEEVGICTLFKNEVSLFGINSFAKPTPVVIAFMEMMEKSPNISADEKKKFSDGID